MGGLHLQFFSSHQQKEVEVPLSTVAGNTVSQTSRLSDAPLSFLD